MRQIPLRLHWQIVVRAGLKQLVNLDPRRREHGVIPIEHDEWFNF